jgi:hypothetical protein
MNDGRKAERRVVSRPIVVVAFAMLIAWASAGEAATTTQAKLRDGRSLRELAQQYLGDPDLWTAILRANGLASVTAAKPGMTLDIPVAQIAGADHALAGALAAIQAATKEGARLLATSQMESCLAVYRQAIARRKAGDWDAAATLAASAQATAEEARKIASSRRDTQAEALLSDRQGDVEGRRPQALVWSDRPLDSLLVEQENVRTLSRSTAQITFNDDSRLRLNANSEAVIERMRSDPLSRHEEAKVSLVQGDFYALLSGRSAQHKFEVEVPEVKADVDSRDFWVRRDASGSKFTNYDDRTLKVAANGESVTLGRDEATLVRNGRPPTDKQAVLPATALVAPVNDGDLFNAATSLRWSAVQDAVGYWLEIADDVDFQRMALTRWGIKETSFAPAALDVGTYYWRVSALDKFGLPGARSDAWRFNVRVDKTPPFLIIKEPPDGTILRTSPARLRGTAEQGVTLRMAGATVRVAADGSFDVPVDLVAGENQVTLDATDAAGNVTKLTRTLVYTPDRPALVRFDPGIPHTAPGQFVTGGKAITLTGSSDPGARLLVVSGKGPALASAFADAKGRFTLSVPLAGPSQSFTIQVRQVSGATDSSDFSVQQDREPPTITLETTPPTVTATEWLVLRGRADGATALTINGKPTDLADGSFDTTLTLRAGRNRVELIATDLVGNRRVDSFDILLDQDPPEILSLEVTPRDPKPGQPVQIALTARDASGLRKVATIRLRVGGTDIDDLLELDGSTGTYRKTLLLPTNASGRVTVREVEVEDYAGNTARLTPDR